MDAYINTDGDADNYNDIYFDPYTLDYKDIYSYGYDDKYYLSHSVYYAYRYS